MNGEAERTRSTTVVAILRGGRVAMAADGQVTVGEMVMKQKAEAGSEEAGSSSGRKRARKSKPHEIRLVFCCDVGGNRLRTVSDPIKCGACDDELISPSILGCTRT